MQFRLVVSVLGVLLVLFGLTMLPPFLVSLWYGDGTHEVFLWTCGMLLGTGSVLWLPTRGARRELRAREGFAVVTLCWVGISLAGALPFMLASPNLTFTGAVFESTSGLTTTGATVITGIDRLPPAILYYRQQLHWLGGMGIILLAVAILPLLGVGGMQLYKAEAPGPVKDAKLTPRIADSAKALWYVYAGLTALFALCYWLAGMSPFDAIGHAYSAVSTGGFSTHDASLAYFGSPALDALTVLFVLLGGVNFSLHFLCLRNRSLAHYFRDSEARLFMVLFLALAVIASATLYLTGAYGEVTGAISAGFFQTASVLTTTGFTNTNTADWPHSVAILLLLAACVGGCAGSTAGGIKVVRMLLLIRQGMREMTRLIHPSAEVSIRIGGKPVPYRVVDAVWAFCWLYAASFTAIYLAIAFTGLDLDTAFSAVSACINNMGIGIIGGAASTFGDLPPTALWLLSFAMLLGRLELFTVLVLLTPGFWRR